MSVNLKQGESVSLGHVMPTRRDPLVDAFSDHVRTGQVSRTWLLHRLANNDLVTLAYLIARDAR